MVKQKRIFSVSPNAACTASSSATAAVMGSIGGCEAFLRLSSLTAPAGCSPLACLSLILNISSQQSVSPEPDRSLAIPRVSGADPGVFGRAQRSAAGDEHIAGQDEALGDVGVGQGVRVRSSGPRRLRNDLPLNRAVAGRFQGDQASLDSVPEQGNQNGIRSDGQRLVVRDLNELNPVVPDGYGRRELFVDPPVQADGIAVDTGDPPDGIESQVALCRALLCREVDHYLVAAGEFAVEARRDGADRQGRPREGRYLRVAVDLHVARSCDARVPVSPRTEASYRCDVEAALKRRRRDCGRCRPRRVSEAKLVDLADESAQSHLGYVQSLARRHRLGEELDGV